MRSKLEIKKDRRVLYIHLCDVHADHFKMKVGHELGNSDSCLLCQRFKELSLTNSYLTQELMELETSGKRK